MASRKDKDQADREALMAARDTCAQLLNAAPVRLIDPRKYCAGDVPIRGIKFPCGNEALDTGSLCGGPCQPTIHFKMEAPKKSSSNSRTRNTTVS